MKKIIFCILVLINTVAAFSNGKKDPYWISNPYDGYSTDKYIVACGSGTTNDDATKKAFSEVGSVLKQDINAQEYVNQSFSSDGKNLSTYLASITTNTNISDISGLSSDHTLILALPSPLATTFPLLTTATSVLSDSHNR